MPILISRRKPLPLNPRTKRALRRRARRLFWEALEDRRMFVDTSSPAILQWFDGSYQTIENRTPDIFSSGYGAIWTPPPGRADSGNSSVGYDVYDRFDLGGPGNPTLYGTETALKTLADSLHRSGADLHIDFVMNHNGFNNQGTGGFQQAGGYPGFYLSYPGDVDGDFHGAFASGDLNMRLSGLIDIAQEKNYQAVRNPVPGFANNLPAGTVPLYGRLANVPDENNRRFYPDQGYNTIFVYDPTTNEANIAISQINTQNPSAGDPVSENAMGYLMRNAQWLVQAIGVDGLRIDAAKHVPDFAFNYIDRAVYRANPRTLLDGSTKNVFSYSEVFDGDAGKLLSYVKKNINPAQPGVIGGNRDVLDFKLYFALKANLENAGTANAWYNIKDAMLDVSDDGMHNGSAGVQFVNNHDVFKPYELADVAQAFILMQPGNAIVYMNGKEFGDGRDFPKDGFGDALGGQYGDTITKLIEARNTHGRGDYRERWVDNQGTFVYERLSSAVVGLSNRGDNGYDTRSVEVGFAPGTNLVELSGNASDAALDPHDDIKEVLTVYHDNGDNKNKIDIRIPRNRNADGVWTGKGYVIYGLAAPQASAGLLLTNVDSVLPGDDTAANNYENGTNRLTDIAVIKANSFQAKLFTQEVRLLGLDSLRDIYADGDNALLKVDGGRDVNGNGHVDFVTPNSVSYGFESFGTKSSPLIGSQGINGPRGDGQFIQTIDATQLEEGYHYLTGRAFRHRTDGGPAIYEDFKQVVYVDRLAPVSAIASFNPISAGVNENRDLVVRSVDKTANSVHVFLNLPASLTNSQIVGMVGANNQAGKIDRDLYKYGMFGVPNGNNVVTIVSFEPTGNVNVQRLPGQLTSTIIGAGLGDVNFDGTYTPGDITVFGNVLASGNTQFNAAADINGDGLINNTDLVQLGPRLNTVDASAATISAYNQLLDQVLGVSVGDFAWNDANGNGLQDGGEAGLAGVTVSLYSSSTSALVSSMTTGASGAYGFSGLSSGSYYLQFAPPAGYIFGLQDQGGNDAVDSDVNTATARTANFILSAGVPDNSRDAGLRNPAPSVDIMDVTPDPRTTGVSQITIAFNKPVSGFNLADLSLSANGGGNLLTPTQTLTTSDNTIWTLANLSGITQKAGNYLLTLLAAGSGITDGAGQPLTLGATDSFTVYATVAGRQIFYNRSKFDGDDSASGAADDAAIASDKAALLPGGVATFANYTSYSRGINGVMIDILGLPAAPLLSELTFRIGNDNNPALWTLAAAPTSIDVRSGAGSGGSDRVSITWPDGAIVNTWLQVTLKATANTGLAAAEVFYIGNAIGETGNSISNAQVNSADEIATRNNSRTFLNPATSASLYDFNRDGLVNATDQILARGNSTTLANSLKLIATPLSAMTAANQSDAMALPEDDAIWMAALASQPTTDGQAGGAASLNDQQWPAVNDSRSFARYSPASLPPQLPKEQALIVARRRAAELAADILFGQLDDAIAEPVLA